MAFTVDATIHDRLLRVPVVQGVGTNLLVDDQPWMDRLIKALPDLYAGTFVDVGVNLGQTLCAVRTIHPDLPYVGFEPNPACIHYAHELVSLNRLSNVPIVPAGLADRDGSMRLDLHMDDATDPSATTVPGMRPGAHTYRSFTVAMMSYRSAEATWGLAPPGLVKIDVEGGELEVLRGLEEHLRNHRPALVIEILPTGRNKLRLDRQVQVEALLGRTAYRLHRIHGMSERPHLEAITGPIGQLDDQTLSNYLVIPVERETITLQHLQQAGFSNSGPAGGGS